VLRKRNFVVSAALRLSSDHPVRETPCVLDTGAEPSVVREDVLPSGWQKRALRAPRSTHVCDASGQLLKVRAQVELSVFVDGAAMPFQFLVVKALSVPVILGMDFQNEHVKAIYPGCETVSWNHGGCTKAENAWDGKKKEPNPVKGNPTRRDGGTIDLRQSVTVAPYTIQAVSVVCGTAGKCRLIERPEKLAEKGLRLHNALANLKPRREFILHLTNISEKPVNLPKGYAIGLAEPYAGPTYDIKEDNLPADVGADPLCVAGPTEDQPRLEAPLTAAEAQGLKTSEPLQDRAQPDQEPSESEPCPRVAYELIPPDLHPAVRQLMDRYKHLWSGQLGRIDVTPHRIALHPGTRPIRSQPYRTGFHHRRLLAEQVAKQLKMGVIEPSQSEWSFPVVMVPKPDGSPRFCVDYRRLNDVTVKDTYPLPRMDDCIDFLGEASVSSLLDCNSGYWQIPVAVEDQDKTTFTCHDGTYKYIRLPFGLTNAPATFQRASDMILSGVKWKTCLVYLDDVIVFSRTVEEHITHLDEVFGLLSRAGVSLKASKCFLFHEEVEYLGHIVGRGHIRVNEKNLVGLRHAEPPRTKKDLRSFLGMCNVYRRFVKDYAQVARPLTALTSPKVSDPLPPFSRDQREAFEELKRRLTNTLILALPRANGAYVVDTDASDYQVGCVLTQEQPDKTFKPIRYWSRPIKGAERNYSTTEKECLAVVWALFMLQPYVQGTRFVVRTDHSALRWMLHMDGAHGRRARWRLRLAEFDYLVETRAGAAHHAADTMSRLATPSVDTRPIPEEIPCLALANSSRAWTTPSYQDRRDYPPITVARLVTAQAQDNRCHELRQEMDRNAQSRFSGNEQGLLVRRAPLDRATQVYVAKALRTEILTLEHAPAHAGHPGANKMYVSMRRFFYWESMVADVYDYVAHCGTCAKGRVGSRRRTNPLRLFPPKEPLAAVCLDLLVPLPKTRVGNRYLLVMVDRFSKLTRVAALSREDAEAVASAFCDTWVASYGPPDTLLTDNGPQ